MKSKRVLIMDEAIEKLYMLERSSELATFKERLALISEIETAPHLQLDRIKTIFDRIKKLLSNNPAQRLFQTFQKYDAVQRDETSIFALVWCNATISDAVISFQTAIKNVDTFRNLVRCRPNENLIFNGSKLWTERRGCHRQETGRKLLKGPSIDAATLLKKYLKRLETVRWQRELI